MATQPQTGLTYEDLQAFPEDNYRRELIDDPPSGASKSIERALAGEPPQV